MRSPLLALALPLALLAPVVPAAHAAPVTDRGGRRPRGGRPRRAGPAPRGCRSRLVAGALDNPWDVKVLPGGRLLVTERDRARLSTYADGDARAPSTSPSNRIWVSGETGLMSLEVDPGFADNRRFYTCSGWQKPGGGHDVRVNAWRLERRRQPRRTGSRPWSPGFPTTAAATAAAGC